MMYDTHDRETEDTSEVDMEDIDIDDVSLEEEESQSSDKIKQLRVKLKDSEAARASLHEDLQRTKADFLNARKRLEEQKALDVERATLRHIEDLLPLLDSFEMAIQNPLWNSTDEQWRKGVEGIYSQLNGILKKNGVTTIDPLGATFDPYQHEALQGEGDTVTEVYQKGYKLNDTIIRPAKVSVTEKN